MPIPRISEGIGGGGRQSVRPAPNIETEYYTDAPPEGELGSAFSYDGEFTDAHNGVVFGESTPRVQDYQQMLRTDGKAGAMATMLTNPIISAPWNIEPAKDDSGEREFVLDALTDLPHQGGPVTTVEQLISQMAEGIINIRAYFEKVMKVNDDGKVVYHKLAYRPPETCEPAYDSRRGEPRGFRQMPIVYDEKGGTISLGWGAPQKDWIYIPPKRAFVYTHGLWKDPVGGYSAMETPYWCFQTKRKIRWLWMQFLDQSVLPKTIVRNPDETQARLDAKKVAQLRGRSVVALQEGSTVDSYEASGRASAEYLTAMQYLDNEMLDSGLLGFMGLSSAAGQGKGSYALAESLSKQFLRTRRMVAHDMARQITNDVIGPLVAYNFGPKAAIPRFKFGPLSESNETDVLDVFAKVATTGAKVPVEFYDQLIERVAQILELDPGRVAKAILEEGSPQEPDNVNQKLGLAVDGATKLMANAQARGEAPAPVGGPAPGSRSVVNGGGMAA